MMVLVHFLCLFLIANCEDCKIGTFPGRIYDGRCIARVSTSAKTWAAARSSCKMAHPSSDLPFVSSWPQWSGILSEVSSESMQWLGAADMIVPSDDSEGHRFLWVDGTPFPTDLYQDEPFTPPEPGSTRYPRCLVVSDRQGNEDTSRIYAQPCSDASELSSYSAPTYHFVCMMDLLDSDANNDPTLTLGSTTRPHLNVRYFDPVHHNLLPSGPVCNSNLNASLGGVCPMRFRSKNLTCENGGRWRLTVLPDEDEDGNPIPMHHQFPWASCECPVGFGGRSCELVPECEVRSRNVTGFAVSYGFLRQYDNNEQACIFEPPPPPPSIDPSSPRLYYQTSWMDARAACKNFHSAADLITIPPTHLGWSSVSDFIDWIGVHFGGTTMSFHLGMHAIWDRNEWEGVDGTPIPTTSTELWETALPYRSGNDVRCAGIGNVSVVRDYYDDGTSTSLLGIFDQKCETPYSVGRTLCAVRMSELTRVENGSEVNRRSNLRFVPDERWSYCNFDKFPCEDEYVCDGDLSLRERCYDKGTCRFGGVDDEDGLEVRLPCECDSGMGGEPYCRRPDWCLDEPWWGYYDGVCYYAPSYVKKRFGAARTACKEWQPAADLPYTLADSDVYEYVVDRFIDSFDDKFGTAWLGATDARSDRTWKFLNGDSLSYPDRVSYRGLYSGSTRRGARWFAYSGTSGGRWDDVVYTQEEYFFCALEIDQYVPPTSNLTNSSVGHTRSPWINVRYHNIDEPTLGKPYCDPKRLNCPEVLSGCQGNPTLREGCNNNGNCTYYPAPDPDDAPGFRCDCDEPYINEFCDRREEMCSVLGQEGRLHDGFCYVRPTTERLNWWNARSRCKNWHAAADLPIVDSAGLNEFLSYWYGLNLWLGMNDFLHEGVFRWVDGRYVYGEEGAGYERMYYENPSSAYHCIYQHTNQWWYPYYCTYTYYYYVCAVKYPDDVNNTVRGSISDPYKNVRYTSDSTRRGFCDISSFDCPAEFYCRGIADVREGCFNRGNCTWFPAQEKVGCVCDEGESQGLDCAGDLHESWCSGGHVFKDVCYMDLSDEYVSWEEARDTCRQWHSAAHLPTLPDSETKVWFQAEFANRPMWLGASDLLAENNFLWNNREQIMLFGSPSSLGVSWNYYQNCLSTSPDLTIWRDRGCHSKRGFVCALYFGDRESRNGSVTDLWLNAEWVTTEKPYGENPFQFCNVDKYICPPELSCNGISDGREACSNTGRCVMDWDILRPRCECDDGFAGISCDIPVESCTILEESGFLRGSTCYVSIDSEVFLDWESARSTCKEWHSASDLPMIETPESTDFLSSVFGHDLWLGLSDVIWYNYEYHWVDGRLLDGEQAEWMYSPNALDCAYIGRDVDYFPQMFGWMTKECSSSNHYVCAVEMAEVGREKTGSAAAPFKNVRYDRYRRQGYCNVDEFPCPDEFWCSGIGDVRKGCWDAGNCTFDPSLRRAVCHCDEVEIDVGNDCGRPEWCDNSIIPEGWSSSASVFYRDGHCLLRTGWYEYFDEARSTCKEWFSAADLISIKKTPTSYNFARDVWYYWAGYTSSWIGIINIDGTWHNLDGTVLEHPPGFSYAMHSSRDVGILERNYQGTWYEYDDAWSDSTYRTICAVNVSEADSSVGSISSPQLNVRYTNFDESDLIQYCDVENFFCPEEFYCGGPQGDIHASCPAHSRCALNWDTYENECTCYWSYYGEDCVERHPVCYIGSQIGVLLDHVCYVDVLAGEEAEAEGHIEMTWYEAREVCKEWHSAAELPILVSEESEAIFQELFGDGVWLGYTDLLQEELWEPMDGTTATYFGWEIGMPEAPGQRHCALLGEDGWNDQYCYGSDESGRPVCGVHVDDTFRNENGSLNPHKNVWIDFEDSWTYEDFPFRRFCDLDSYRCPDEFLCLHDCSGRGTCFFDELIEISRCNCTYPYRGVDCSIRAENCSANGQPGYLFDSECYFVLSSSESEEVSWVFARDACKDFHSAADLPQVQTQEIHEFLVDTFGYGFWIGLFDHSFGESDGWMWANGTSLDDTFNGFAHEPDESLCAAIWLPWIETEFGWEDHYMWECYYADMARFVCVVDENELGMVTGGSQNLFKNVRITDSGHDPYYCNFEEVTCPDEFYCAGVRDLREGCGFTGTCEFESDGLYPRCKCDHGWDGSYCQTPTWCGQYYDKKYEICYEMSTSSHLSWSDARRRCKHYIGSSADLPVFPTLEAAEFFWDNIYSGSGDPIWLGATDTLSEGNFSWVDGYLFNISGESVVVNGDSDQNCLVLGPSGNFEDRSCLDDDDVWSVCARGIGDYDSHIGSVVHPTRNIQYEFLDEEDGIETHPYCDFEMFAACPAEFWCSWIVDLEDEPREGCSDHGVCRFDENVMAARCDCEDPYSGHNCSEIPDRCEVTNTNGQKVLGLEYDGKCYLSPLLGSFFSWEDARRLCKEFHTASDLPIVYDHAVLGFLDDNYERFWLGLTNVFTSSWQWIDAESVVNVTLPDGSPACAIWNDGWTTMDCQALSASFVCVVDEAEYDRTHAGSLNPNLNVLYHFGDERSYCDFDSFVCPDELWCSGDPSEDGRAGCSLHGSCEFSHEDLIAECDCDDDYSGGDCSVPNACVGSFFNGICYFVPDSPALAWSDARDFCKENFHLSSDLPVILDAEMETAFRQTFGPDVTTWLGASDAIPVVGENWRWLSGEPVLPLNGVAFDENESGNCLLFASSGTEWAPVSCDGEYSFVCGLSLTDIDSTRGSVDKKWLNVLYEYVAEDDETQTQAYCDIERLNCPPQFWCNSVEDETAGCNDQGTCVYNQLGRFSKCDCEVEFEGEFCETPATTCEAAGSTGILVGDHYCLVDTVLERREAAGPMTWSQAREFCKEEWHSASDLPIFDDDNNELRNYYYQRYGPGIWLGMSNFVHEDRSWKWVDGTDVVDDWWGGPGGVPTVEDRLCGVLLSDIDNPPLGIGAAPCLSPDYRVVCALMYVDRDRERSGSTIANVNVRFDFLRDYRYCSFDRFDDYCPIEYGCLTDTGEFTFEDSGCSGRGRCSFNQATNRPECQCETGWAGDRCQLESTEYASCNDLPREKLANVPIPYDGYPKWSDYKGVVEIRIDNPSGAAILDPPDLLIELDTTALKCRGTIRPNCDDIFFTDSEEEIVPFSLESGCGTYQMRVWIRPKTVPNSGLTVYMFHHSATAEDESEIFTGQFVTVISDVDAFVGWGESGCLLGSTCVGLDSVAGMKDGWMVLEDMDNRFVRLGDPAVELDEGIMGAHRHLLEGRLTSVGESSVSIRRSSGPQFEGLSKLGHFHDFSAESDALDAEEDFPPFSRFLFLGSNRRLPTPLPPSSLLLFPTTSAILSSENFGVYDGDRLFPLGASTSRLFTMDPETKIVSKKSSTPRFGGSLEHRHKFVALGENTGHGWSDSNTDYFCQVAGSSVVSTLNAPHSHSTANPPIRSEFASSVPYYFESVLGVANDEVVWSTISADVKNNMRILATSLPPLGWRLVGAVEDRYLRAVSTGTSSSQLGLIENAVHSHSLSFQTQSDDVNPTLCEKLVSGSEIRAKAAHTHAYSSELSELPSELPSRSFLLIERKKEASLPYRVVGNYTLEWRCNRIDAFDPKVCSSAGNCIAEDHCECTKVNRHGQWCGETIYGAWFESNRVFYVNWTVPLADYFEVRKGDPTNRLHIPCDVVVAVNESLVDSKCEWHLGPDPLYTQHLRVELGPGSSFDGGGLVKMPITVLPVTDSTYNQRSVLVLVAAIVQTFYEAVIAATVTLMFVVIVAVVLFVVFVVVLIRCCKIRKENVKYGELEDFDILLQDQIMVNENQSVVTSLMMKSGLFEIGIEEIDTKSVLGQGGSGGTVFHAIYDGQDVAFKRYKLSELIQDEGAVKEFRRELKIMYSLHHPHLLACYGAILKPPFVGIVMEFCSKGDVRAFLQKFKEQEGRPYPLKEKIRLLEQVANAMNFLHKREIMHRDLKCQNVLVDQNENCKIMDFGMSRIVRDAKTEQTKAIGTSLYMAPEMILGDEYNFKVDVFSFSMMLYCELADDWYPYGKNAEFVEFKVANSPFFRPKISNVACPLWLKDLARKAWSHKARKRPTFQQIVDAFATSREVKDPICVYLKKEGGADEDAEDYLLKLLTLEELHTITKLQYAHESIRAKHVEFFSETDDGHSISLMSDEDVLTLPRDAMISVRFVGEDGASEHAKKTRFECDEGFVEFHVSEDGESARIALDQGTSRSVESDDISSFNCVVDAGRIRYTLGLNDGDLVRFTILEEDGDRCSELLSKVVHSSGDMFTIECLEGILEVKVVGSEGELRMLPSRHEHGIEPVTVRSDQIISIDCHEMPDHDHTQYDIGFEADGDDEVMVLHFTLDSALKVRFEGLLNRFLNYSDGVSVECQEGTLEVVSTGEGNGDIVLHRAEDGAEVRVHTSAITRVKVTNRDTDVRYEVFFDAEEGEGQKELVVFHLAPQIEEDLRVFMNDLLNWQAVLARTHGQRDD